MKKKRIFGLAGLAAVVLAAGAGIYYTTSQHDSKGNGDLKVVGDPITVILSEEKETHNLRTLLLSGVKGYEYITSTLILPFLLALIIMVVVPLILGVSIASFLNYAIVILLTSIVIIMLYLFLGLLTRSQVEAQVFSVPAMLLVAFLPMLSNLDKNVAKVVDYSFMGLFTEYVTKWRDFSWNEAFSTSVSLVCWIILLIIGNFLVIKKKGRM